MTGRAPSGQALVSDQAPTGLDPSGFDPSRKVDMRAWRMLERIVDATHSHIDGRDLLGELHPRKTLDIKRRVDGRETWFEGDWLSGVWDAVKEARALLYTKGREQATTYRNTGSPEAAQGIEAREGEDVQQASREAREPGPKDAPQ